MSGLVRNKHIYVNGNKARVMGRSHGKWKVKTGSTVSWLDPLVDDWCYCFKKPINRWKKALPVILNKHDLSAFKYKKERFGKWTGAATSQTFVADLPVWQIVNTSRVFVGHLGEFKFVKLDNNAFVPINKIPKNYKNIYIGKGSLTFTKFKCLKLADRNLRLEPRRKKTKPLYSVPTREELSTHCK